MDGVWDGKNLNRSFPYPRRTVNLAIATALDHPILGR
jgi:hypothetical protein